MAIFIIEINFRIREKCNFKIILHFFSYIFYEYFSLALRV